MKRRQFIKTSLQATSATIAALGLNGGIRTLGSRYSLALSQPVHRKFALLVGVNQYDTLRATTLRGCHTDTDLQRHLLMHRFGFDKDDICVLSDPNREEILDAFQRRLVDRVTSEDLVVLHFSGHGSRFIDPDPVDGDSRIITAIVPRLVPDENAIEPPDITSKHLFLLRSQLPTERVTTVLDCCYSGGGTRGDARVRSISAQSGIDEPPIEMGEAERGAIAVLQSGRGWTDADLRQARQRGQGLVLAASGANDPAYDFSFPGFHAGNFTYRLTQYLWQVDSPLDRAVTWIKPTLRRNRQIPLVAGNTATRAGSNRKAYFVETANPPAEGTLLRVDGDVAEVWLGGIPPDAMAPGVGFAFDVTDRERNKVATATWLDDRTGLVGKVRLSPMAGATVSSGDLLRETRRQVAADLKLYLGLDPSLGEELEVARGILQQENRAGYEAVGYDGTRQAYTEPIDYILARLTAENREQLREPSGDVPLPELGTVGLVSLDWSEVIPESFDRVGESVEEAIERLNGKFRALRIAKTLKQFVNGNSTDLKIGIELKDLGEGGEIVPLTLQAFEARSDGIEPRFVLPTGGRYQFVATNRDSRPLYCLPIVIDPEEGVFPRSLNSAHEVPIQESETAIGAEIRTGSPGRPEVLFLVSTVSLADVELVLAEPERGSFLLDLVNAIEGRSDRRSSSERPEVAAFLVRFEVRDE